MKLTVGLIIFTVLGTMAADLYSQTTRLSLNSKNESVVDLLRSIEDQSKFRFFYNEEVKLDFNASVEAVNASIEQILDKIFEGSDITYKILGRQIVLTNKTLDVSDQKITVKGKVTDSSGAPLPGVTVLVKGTTQGIITNVDGNYSLESVPGDAVLVFSFVGMKSQEIAVAGKTSINVTMEEETIGLDEVVAVGYGTQSRRTVTTAMTNVDGKVLKDVPISTVGDGLKGKIAGVRIYTNDNTPGADPVIRIRGGSSINNSNNPLILVDGIERSLAGLNPNDIESINVLKDAASTAIYGSRASNGVILVTTKSGSRNEAPRITFEMTAAYQELERRIDFMNAEDYINIVRPAVAEGRHASYNYLSGYSASSGNDDGSMYSTRYLEDGEEIPAGYKSMPDPLDESKTLIFQDNNFQDQTYKNALWQNYYVGVDGGNDKIRYAASLGYTDDTGVAIATSFSRVSAHANTDVKISDKFSLSTGIDFSRTKSEEFTNQKNILSRGLSCPPTQRVYYSDGTPTPGYNKSSPSPVWYKYYFNYEKVKDRLDLFGKLNYQIIDNLKFTVDLSYFQNIYQYDYFQKANEFNGQRTTESGFEDENRTKLDSYFSYIKVLNNDHTISATAGYSYQVDHDKTFSAEAEGASSDKVQTLSAGTATDADSNFEKEVLIGYFGRFSYDYLKKYLVSLTFRADGSSKFTEGNRWGFFPGASVGWIVSEEPFWKELTTIPYLKMRASYGQTGNNGIDIYDAVGEYDSSVKYDGNSGIVPETMPNQSLTWETTTQLDLGFDLGLFDNRITLNADYFNKVTDNLLFDKELPNTSGFDEVETNYGKVRFRGFDLELTTRNIQKNNFAWESKFVWSYVKNKVLRLPDNGRDKNRIGGITLDDGTAYGGTAEGEPLYRYYGYKVEKILETEEEAAAARYDSKAIGYSSADGTTQTGRKSVGDYEWQDRDGNETINSYDQYELGVTVPHTTGGLNNSFKYKNFNLNIYCDWALGHSINSTSYMRYFMNTFANNYTLVNEVKKCWTQAGDKTKYARFTANDPDDGNSNFSRTSNIFNYKGDYLCIREVSLQYNVPSRIISKWGFYGLTLILSGNNLHYFTAVKGGVSPEIGTSTTYDSSYYNYPPIRRYSFGVKVTF